MLKVMQASKKLRYLNDSVIDIILEFLVHWDKWFVKRGKLISATKAWIKKAANLAKQKKTKEKIHNKKV